MGQEYKWIRTSEQNPPKKGFYAVRYRSRLNKNARVFTARYRKGKWDMYPKGYKPEYFFAWCNLPDASPLQPPPHQQFKRRIFLERRRMEDKIKVISLKKTCASCPSQWDGLTDDNRQVYYRFRWGWLTVTIGKPNDMEQYAAVGGEVIFESDLSHGLDGELSTGDMITITKKKINYQIPESDIEAIRKYEADDYELQQENTEWIAKAMGLA